MLSALLLLLATAEPVQCAQAQTCSTSCEQQARSCKQECRRERRARPFHPEDDRGGATAHLSCAEACEFDAGACEATCPSPELVCRAG